MIQITVSSADLTQTAGDAAKMGGFFEALFTVEF